MALDALSNDAIDSLRSATVYSSDGDKIGKVGDVYLGDETGQPEWVTVKTGLFGTSETFVPLAQASTDGDEIRVPFTKDQVKDAPRTEADGQISPEEEDRLFSHYGMGGTTGGGDRADGFVEGTGTSRGDYEGLDERGAASGEAVVPGGTGIRRDGDSDSDGELGAHGRDTSGPTTDDAMTRSEERLHVGTERREAGRARLRKHVVTERQTAQVGTSRDELVVEREPITDANRGAATSGAQLSEEEHEVVLHEEVPLVSKTVEPVERVRIGTQTQHDTQAVAADVAHEEIELDADGTGARTSGRHADLDLDADAERADQGAGRTTGRDGRV
jgi:uncharacterized protein (TIGR02271 family)